MTIYSGFSHWKWWFSIVFCIFTRGYHLGCAYISWRIMAPGAPELRPGSKVGKKPLEKPASTRWTWRVCCSGRPGRPVLKDAVINVDDICERHSWSSISSVLYDEKFLDTPILILCDVSARCEVRDWVLRGEWLNFLWWFHINSTVCLIKGDLLPANRKISTKEWIEDYPRTAFRRAVQTPFELLRAGSAFIYT
jgi:hypothetical protein